MHDNVVWCECGLSERECDLTFIACPAKLYRLVETNYEQLLPERAYGAISCEELNCPYPANHMFKWSFAYSLLCDDHFAIAEETRLQHLQRSRRSRVAKPWQSR